MPIRQYISDHDAFEQHHITAMSQALEEACAALRVHVRDRSGRETIAARIIDLARSGVVDPKALRDRVLLEAKSDA